MNRHFSLARIPGAVRPTTALPRHRPARRGSFVSLILLATGLLLGNVMPVAAYCVDTTAYPLSHPEQDFRMYPNRDYADVQAAAAVVAANYGISEPDLFRDGILDVTKAPYNVKANFSHYATTCALQKALLDARDAQLVVFVPGNSDPYNITDQLICISGYIEPEEVVASEARKRQDDFPCVLRGSSDPSGPRTTFRLKDNADPFNINNPDGYYKSVFVFTARNMRSDPKTGVKTYSISSPTSFNSTITNIDINLGTNPRAIGIDNQGAQGSVIEDVNITATGAFAGFRGLPGSGGSMTDVSVTGGEYGIYATMGKDLEVLGLLTPGHPNLYDSGSQPVPLVNQVTLTGQTMGSIYFVRGGGVLTVIGADINGTQLTAGMPAITLSQGAISDGHLNLVDSKITTAGGTTTSQIQTISGNRNVYLNNVFTTAATKPFDIVKLKTTTAGAVLTSNLPDWTRVKEYAVGGDFTAPGSGTSPGPGYPIWSNLSNPPSPNPTYVAYNAGMTSFMTAGVPMVPTDLQTRHSWDRPGNRFPTWQDVGVVNIRDKFSAMGNGMVDDRGNIQKAIDCHSAVTSNNPAYINAPNYCGANYPRGLQTLFLPKGIYKLSKPLKLYSDTRLIGVGNRYTTLSPLYGATATSDFKTAAANAPLPLIDAPSNVAAATTAIGFMQLRTVIPGAAALRWRMGENSVVRNLNLHRFPWLEGEAPAEGPHVHILGNGGGRWYNTYQIHSGYEGLGYRSMLARNTTQKLRFYALNPEHAGIGDEESATEYQAEFDNADNVNVYSFKSETHIAGFNATWAPLGIKNSTNVQVFGYGGQARGSNNPNSGNAHALIHIIDSSDYLLANIVHAVRAEDCAAPMVCNWKVMHDIKAPSTVPTTPTSTQRVTLLRRGDPLINP